MPLIFRNVSFVRNIEHLSSLDYSDLRDKKALLRIDANVPLTAEGAVDFAGDWRLRAVVPTIQQLQQNGVGTIVLSHLGRPQGVVDRSLSLASVANRLAELLRKEVTFVPSVLGPDVDTAVGHLNGGVLMLENLRFDPGEEGNDAEFTERLASLGDLYVNDAFAASHREHASIVGLPRLLPSVAGLLLGKEVAALTELLVQPSHPLVLILGGAKITTKAPVVQRFSDRADTIVLVGALANSVLAARGVSVGASVVENVPAAMVHDDSLLLPRDVVTASSLQETKSTIVDVGDVPNDALVVDIGPETIADVQSIVEDAATVVWNGPSGFVENTVFATGTRAIADLLAASSATVIVGGGDTTGYLQRQELLTSFSHVSTGGGAMLEYLAHGTLPGIEALQSSSV